MIAGEELAAWLGSRERQGKTAAMLDAARSSWSGDPALLRLRQQADQACAAPEALIAAARAFFDEPGPIDTLIDTLVAASSSDPFFRPPFRLVATELHSGMLLFDNPGMMISLGVVRLEPLAARKTTAGPSSIMFSGQWTMLRLIRAGGATFSFWEAPPVGADFAGDSAGNCRLVERRSLADGETILLDGRSQSFVIDNASSDLVLLQANIASGAAPLTVEYDSRTYRFVAASNGDEQGSRLEMMASLLRLLDHREAIPVLLQAMPRSSFTTRWQVMREVLAWDAAAALPGLQAMAADDPHPEVRAAAKQTLALFFENAPCPA